MPLVYRSVRVVVLNCSQALLTVEGAEVLLGEWAPGCKVKDKGAGVGPQSAYTIATQSSAMQTGSEAFVRFSSVMGPIHLHWCLPWVGEFALQPDIPPNRWRTQVDIYDEDPSAIAALVTLRPMASGV
jgi:hypothetical protein